MDFDQTKDLSIRCRIIERYNAGIESESPVEKSEGLITCWSKHEASENINE
jgi:hypothetical protein